jgi:hypothetical protein
MGYATCIVIELRNTKNEMPMNRPGTDEKIYNKTRMITRFRKYQIGHKGYVTETDTALLLYTVSVLYGALHRNGLLGKKALKAGKGQEWLPLLL